MAEPPGNPAPNPDPIVPKPMAIPAPRNVIPFINPPPSTPKINTNAITNAKIAVGRSPKHMGLLTRTMIIGQAITETTDIYSLVVALILIFVV